MRQYELDKSSFKQKDAVAEPPVDQETAHFAASAADSGVIASTQAISSPKNSLNGLEL
jgi:hypothetical protein